MATTQVLVELLGDDKLSGPLGSATKALSGVDDAATKSKNPLGQLTDVFGKIGLAGLGAKAIFDGVVGGVSALIGPAIDAQKVTAQLESVLASTGGKAGMTRESIEALSGSLSKVTMFEDEAITSAQSLLLTFTNVGQDVFPKATETILNMSQALGQDLSASSMQLGKALNDPIAGIASLRRVGVQLTDQQEEQIKTMMAVGDIAGAQGVILAELETQFGGAAVAAGETFGGQLVILQNAFGDVMEVIGGPVLAGLSGLLKAVLPLVIQFGAALPGAIDTMMGVLGPIVGFISGNLRPIVAAATAAFVTWAAVTLTTLVPAFIAWAATATTAAAATVIALAPVLLPIAAIGAAAFLLTKAWESNWGDIQGKTEAVWGVLQPIWDFVLAYFTNLGDNLVILRDLFVAGWELMSAAVTAAWDPIIMPIWDLMVSYFTTLGEGLGILRDLFVAGWALMAAGVTAAWNGIILPAWDVILAYFGTLGTNLGILRDAFVTAWGLISGAVTTAWGVISPAFDTLGTGLTAAGTAAGTLAAGWGTSWTAISTAVSTSWAAISGAVTGGIATLSAAFTNAGPALVGLLRGGFEAAIGGFRASVAARIAEIAALLPHSLAEEGPLSVPTDWGDVLEGNLEEVAGFVVEVIQGMGDDLAGTIAVATGASRRSVAQMRRDFGVDLTEARRMFRDAGQAAVGGLATGGESVAVAAVVAQRSVRELARAANVDLTEFRTLMRETGETAEEVFRRIMPEAVLAATSAADGLADSLSPLDGILSGLTGAVGGYSAALLAVPTNVSTTIGTVLAPGGAGLIGGRYPSQSSDGGGAGAGSSSGGSSAAPDHPSQPGFDWGAYNAANQGKERTPDGLVKRAAGGPVGGGWPYWVGEGGPELFVPKTDGTILPNGAGWGGGKGGSDQQPIVIHNHLYIDGREIGVVTRTETRRFTAANAGLGGVGGALPRA